MPDLPVSVWGPVITLAQAEQPNAPALAVSESGVTAAWVGADEQGVFQALRTLNNDAPGEPIRLPLGVRPYAQQFASAGNGRQHLFWLDSNVEGETRLFTALLKPNLERERELTILTREVTRRYTLLPAAEGGVWAIASGGLASEPSLNAHFVDGDGRWRLNENDRIATDADWPTLLQHADGTVSLYWLRDTDNRVMRGLFNDGVLLNPQPLVDSVTLNAGDRLESFTAAQDNAYAYLFWNVTRVDGSRETWYTAAPPDTATWERPTRLTIDVPDDIATASWFDSGFNVGVVFAASDGEDNVSWVVPASGRFPVLPVAALVGREISVMFMREGQIVGYRPMGLLTDLIGLPTLAVDRDLYIYLSWAQPDPAGYANLQLVGRKVGLWSWVENPRSD
ncbi:MAG: hypothetical protein LCI00_26320 [Chloroflexi bacterium]|nr:hypothetical protein [Chloroflexota bacterium]